VITNHIINEYYPKFFSALVLFNSRFILGSKIYNLITDPAFARIHGWRIIYPTVPISDHPGQIELTNRALSMIG
jgi:hypothetical protein